MESPLKSGIHTRLHPEKRGFSLVEILIVISVIGILAAVIIPQVGRMADLATETKAKQNAQNTARISGALSAAGVEHVVPESLGGAEATTRLLRRGITVSQGPMAGAHFGMPNLSEEEVQST